MPEKSVMGVRSETANSYAELSLETRLMYARCLSGTNGGGAAVEAAVAVDGVAILAGGTVTDKQATEVSVNVKGPRHAPTANLRTGPGRSMGPLPACSWPWWLTEFEGWGRRLLRRPAI